MVNHRLNAAMISAYLETLLLNYAFRGDASNTPTQWYAALADPFGNEIVDPGYARVTASFNPAVNGTSPSATAMTFGLFQNAQTIASLQVWDAGAGGNLLYGGPADQTETFAAGANEGVIIWPGQLGVTLT
jgi:hypothetical protein